MARVPSIAQVGSVRPDIDRSGAARERAALRDAARAREARNTAAAEAFGAAFDLIGILRKERQEGEVRPLGAFRSLQGGLDREDLEKVFDAIMLLAELTPQGKVLGGTAKLGSAIYGVSHKSKKAARALREAKKLPVPNETQKFVSDIHSALRKNVNTGELAEFKRLDPKARIGLTGSASTGRVGNPKKYTPFVNREDFDLDIFVQSDELFAKFGGKLKAAPRLRKALEEQFPDLFKGLRQPGKKGVSIKFRPSSESLPTDVIIFE